MFSLLLANALLLGALSEPIWQRDFEQARALAKWTNRPLFVVFRCEH